MVKVEKEKNNDLHIERADPTDWAPFDFVRYFHNRSVELYGEIVETNYERDCPMMKHIMDTFTENSRTNLSVLHFLDWSFDRYQEKKMPPPITIGFLKCWVPVFLQIPVKRKKVYNRLKEVKLTAEQKRWIASQKKEYGTPERKRRTRNK